MPQLPALTLKILLVDADDARATDLTKLLGATGFHHVRHVPGGASLADEVTAFMPGVVIIDMALPDRDTLEGLRQNSARVPRPVLVFADDPVLVEEAIAAGVSFYHVGDGQAIKPILTAAIALFRLHRQTEKKGATPP